MAAQQLDRLAVARVTGLQPKTLDVYRRRGVMPDPDGYIGRSPWWWDSTIESWDKLRRKMVPTRWVPAQPAAKKPRKKAGA